MTLDGGEAALTDLSKLGAWHWDRIRERHGGRTALKAFKTFPLAAGEHVLALRNRESGTRIGALIIIRKDQPFDPARDFKVE